MDVTCEIPADQPSTSQSSVASFDDLFSTAPWWLLVSPFFFWGTSMVVMKSVTAHSTPLFLGTMRLLPAGIALVAWGAANGRPQPSTPVAWLWIAAFAAVDGAMFQGFLSEGLQRTSAGLGSVIIDSQPLTVAVLAALLFGEKLGAKGVAGLLLGVAGLTLLEVPAAAWAQAGSSLAAGGPSAGGLGEALHSLLGGGSAASMLDSGEFYMLLAAQSMAVGTVMVRWVTKHCDSVMATGWHMVLGGLALAGLSLAQEPEQLAARLQYFTPADAASMLYASMLGGAAGYGVFFYLAGRGSLTTLSSLTFLTPMFASIADFFLLHETLTPLQLAGAVVTLVAVFMISSAPKAAKS